MKRFACILATMVLVAAFCAPAFAGFGSNPNGGLSVSDVTGTTSNTNIVSFAQTAFKWAGIVILSGAMVGGMVMLIKGIFKMTKQGHQGGQDAKGAVWEIIGGALLIVISIIIGIVSYTMSDASNRNAGQAPAVMLEHVRIVADAGVREVTS